MTLQQQQQLPEVTLWNNTSEGGGIFHKHVVQEMAVTNYNVILVKENQPTIKVPLTELNDILIANQYRTGNSVHRGMSFGRGVRMYTGNSQFASQNRGDILFMRQGIPALRFNNIPDARSVVMIAKSAKKNLIERSKEPAITAGMNSLFKN